MSAAERHLTRSVEDYLKAIYSLSERGMAATTNSIAEVMEVQPASVTGMIKRLAESRLLKHAPYRGVHLTQTGKREALRVIRRHRIIESYLTEHLGYRWDDVHAEAERLEHAASDELVDRMATALSDPSHDPHGAPIPTSQGIVERMDPMTLLQAPEGRFVIRAVRDDDADALRALAEKGLIPGAAVVVGKGNSGRDVLRVRIGGSDELGVDVGAELAGRVFVSPQPGPQPGPPAEQESRLRGTARSAPSGSGA